MHGDPVDVIAARVADLSGRRAALGLPPLQFGMAAYTIVRASEAEARRELARITAVRPRLAGLRQLRRTGRPTRSWSGRSRCRTTRSPIAGCAPGWSARRAGGRARARLPGRRRRPLLLLQCSPQLEEMERFAAEVMPLVGDATPAVRAA
jgi:FMNH2-dependent dimethyl sulfone monooxygenase